MTNDTTAIPTPPMTLHRAFEMSGIAAFFVLDSWLLYRLGSAAAETGSWLAFGAAAFAGYVGADFGSGIAHWGFDRYGTVDTPVLGPNFIKPFREHHVDPKGITRHDFVETNGNNCIATIPFLLAGLAIPLAGPWGVFGAGFFAFISLFGFGTNQFHKWSHEATLPGWVKLLQRAHLVLGVEHHDVHHQAPFNKYYCITSGALNPFLTKIGFFPRVEALIYRVTGVRGGANDAEYSGIGQG